MFLRHLSRITRTIGVRLNLWYAVVFTLSAGVGFLLLYVLLSRAVQAKDHEIIETRLKEYALIYGRRRIVVAVLLGFVFGALSREFLVFRLPGGLLEFQTIGFIIPGLIANWMERQGVVQTLAVMVTTAVLVRLCLMLLHGGEVIV